MTAFTDPVLDDDPSPPLGNLDVLLLDPLSEFFDVDGLQVIERESLDDSPLPEPQRGLLVHDRDMTSTLEAFHSESIGLDVLGRRLHGESLLRHVLLHGTTSRRVVEYGAIRIQLANFPHDARQAVLDGRMPLGSILSVYRIPYESRPRRFFSIHPDERLCNLLGLDGCEELHGRRNLLATPDGRTLAEVVEILPPGPASA
ncbi:MAG: hypothetical protein AAGE94_03725 [Acidobacteriota bacterium]